jgi:hypothetical protein
MSGSGESRQTAFEPGEILLHNEGSAPSGIAEDLD